MYIYIDIWNIELKYRVETINSNTFDIFIYNILFKVEDNQI